MQSHILFKMNKNDDQNTKQTIAIEKLIFQVTSCYEQLEKFNISMEKVAAKVDLLHLKFPTRIEYENLKKNVEEQKNDSKKMSWMITGTFLSIIANIFINYMDK